MDSKEAPANVDGGLALALALVVMQRNKKMMKISPLVSIFHAYEHSYDVLIFDIDALSVQSNGKNVNNSIINITLLQL